MTENMNENAENTTVETDPTAPMDPTPAAEAADTPTTPTVDAAAAEDKRARILRTNRIALAVGGSAVALLLLAGTFSSGLAVGSKLGGGDRGRAGHAMSAQKQGGIQEPGFDGQRGQRGGKGGHGFDGKGGQGQRGDKGGRGFDGKRGPNGSKGQNGDFGRGGQNLPQGHPDTSAPSTITPQSNGAGNDSFSF